MKVRLKFNGSDALLSNYSHTGQDLFALMALNGKRNGTYLEIGAGYPIYNNNTYLLESQFGWTGVAVDYEKQFYDMHKQERKHHIKLSDAVLVDYAELLVEGGIDSKQIDYLSLDLDGESTINTLYKLPLETHKFAVVTFEHDAYRFGDKYKILGREHFKKYGYELVVSNVFLSGAGDFEDWWIHPDLIEKTTIESLRSDGDSITEWSNYIFGDV